MELDLHSTNKTLTSETFSNDIDTPTPALVEDPIIHPIQDSYITYNVASPAYSLRQGSGEGVWVICGFKPSAGTDPCIKPRIADKSSVWLCDYGLSRISLSWERRAVRGTLTFGYSDPGYVYASLQIESYMTTVNGCPVANVTGPNGQTHIQVAITRDMAYLSDDLPTRTTFVKGIDWRYVWNHTEHRNIYLLPLRPWEELDSWVYPHQAKALHWYKTHRISTVPNHTKVELVGDDVCDYKSLEWEVERTAMEYYGGV